MNTLAVSFETFSNMGLTTLAAIVLIGLTLLYFGRRIFGGVFGFYRIVPPNEAHIRVQGNKKEIFSHRDPKTRSAYWYVPGITKVNKLPLQNLTVSVNDIKLNDKDMAPFQADVVCFINIKDVELASERLVLSDSETKMGFDFVRLGEDFNIIIQSVARTTVTKHSILEVYMNRQALAEALTKEVASVFPQWGVQLVNLELKHIKDVEDSTIIADIERKVAAEIRRDADIKTAQTTREADMAKAENREQAKKRDLEADKAIGLSQAQKDLEVAEAKQKANAKEIEAQRTLDIGKADIARQTIEKNAQATKYKLETEAAGKGEAIKLEATGEAEAIRIKKVADAEGTEKLAKALALFDDKAFSIRQLEAIQAILSAKFNALATIGKEADIKWIMSGENGQKFFGLDLNANGGANLEQFLIESGLKEAMGNGGSWKDILAKLNPKTTVERESVPTPAPVTATHRR